MLIDAEGRLLGRWNLIDVAVIGVVGLVLVCGVAAGTMWVLRAARPVPVRAVDVDLLVNDASTTQHPVIGETLFDRKRQPIGRVTDVLTASSLTMSVRLDVPFKHGRVFKLNGAWAGKGSLITLQSAQARYTGVIGWLTDQPHFWIRAAVRFHAVPQALALTIRHGDYQLNANGRVIARVSETPFIETYRLSQDLLVLLDLWIARQDPYYLFQGEPLRIGKTVVFETPSYSVEGMVLELTSLDNQPLLPAFVPAAPPHPKEVQVHANEIPVQKTVQVKVRFDLEADELAYQVRVGDEQRGRAGTVVAQVKRVLFSQPLRANPSHMDERGQDRAEILYMIPASIPTLTAILELSCLTRGEALFYHDRQLRIGSEIQFRTHHYQLQGVVLQFVSGAQQEVWMDTMVLTDLLLPEAASLIQPGDQDTAGGTEPSAEVLEVILLEDQPVDGKSDVAYQRARVTMRLRCTQEGSAILYNDRPVKVGYGITFRSNHYDFFGVILSLQPVGASHDVAR